MKTNRNSSPKNLLLLLLKTQSHDKSNREQGYILVVAISIVLALSGLVALYAKTNNQSERATTTALASSNTGFYAVESALNIRANEIREKFLNYGTPEGESPAKADACFDPNADQGNGDFVCDSMTIKSKNDLMSDTLVTTYAVRQNDDEGVQGIVPEGDAYQGLSMVEYGYSLYGLSFKDDGNRKEQGKQATAVIEMDIKSRSIPMFQFATFYVGDLEIAPGPNMTLSGPVHTNGNLFLGSDNTLSIKGQITTVKDIYSRRKYNPANLYANGKVKISTKLPDISGDFLKSLVKFATGSTAATANAMDPKRIADNWGDQIKVKTDAPVSIPKPSILNKDGDYYEKADIRITFKPVATSTDTAMPYLNTVPFEVTALDRSDENNITSKVLTEAQLKSLRQPIMVGKDLADIPVASEFNVCGTVDTSKATSVTNAVAEKAQDHLITQIQSQSKPVLFSSLNALNPTLLGSTAPSGINATEWIAIQTMTPQQIAGLTGRCFVAAPILEVGRDNSGHKTSFRYVNVREGNRDMRLLQTNIQSLAIWNRDGIYLNGTTLTSTADLLYARAAADDKAPANSFQRLGLAAKDDTEGGIVVHATIEGNTDVPVDADTTTYHVNSNGTITYPKAITKKSPYGFAFVNGKQLFGLAKSDNVTNPTGVTIASDQAIYVQGDYNLVYKQDKSNPDAPLLGINDPEDPNIEYRKVNYQPASVLADSFNALSNACLNNDKAINNNGGKGCNINGSNGTKATETTFNAAILAGVDVTLLGKNGNSGYNGGLENYPRFAENWSGINWNYRGSFVSIDQPLYVSGTWKSQAYNPPNRNWDYDQNFNDPRNLPPLTPQFVVLKQESFIRSFDQ